jgi:hypothetical protein
MQAQQSIARTIQVDSEIQYVLYGKTYYPYFSYLIVLTYFTYPKFNTHSSYIAFPLKALV